MDINFFMPTRVIIGKYVGRKNCELFKRYGREANASFNNW